MKDKKRGKYSKKSVWCTRKRAYHFMCTNELYINVCREKVNNENLIKGIPWLLSRNFFFIAAGVTSIEGTA